VKDELCKVHGIKGSICLDSLQRLVEDAVSELKEEQDRALLEALPDTVTASIDHFMKGARDAFAIMVAEQNAKLMLMPCAKGYALTNVPHAGISQSSRRKMHDFRQTWRKSSNRGIVVSLMQQAFASS
jgi:hypothetical protein